MTLPAAFWAVTSEYRPLHPSCGHLQSSLVGFRSGTSYFPLEGLRPRWQARQYDSGCYGVLAALLPARAPQRVRTHSSLRVPRQSLSYFPLGSIPTTPVQPLLHACRSGNLQTFSGGFFCLALPTLRRGHDRNPEIYRCGIINMLLLRFFITPPPLSTRRMCSGTLESQSAPTA